MPNLFHPSANTLSRLSLAAAAGLPLLLLFVGSGITRSSANTKVDVPLDQPVPFSHEHHVSELGIDCRYCHTTVEKSSFAGIPPTHTCMSCHSQIWTNSPLLQPIRDSYQNQTPIQAVDGTIGWARVNKLPEFVYFNHSIHIARGVVCNQCHGPIQRMQLTYKGKPFFMSWCLQCHANPEKYLYRDPEAAARGMSPREQVFNLYYKAQKGDARLNRRELAIAAGEDYAASGEDLAKGEQLIEQYHVKKVQLQDCWVCHR